MTKEQEFYNKAIDDVIQIIKKNSSTQLFPTDEGLKSALVINTNNGDLLPILNEIYNLKFKNSKEIDLKAKETSSNLENEKYQNKYNALKNMLNNSTDGNKSTVKKILDDFLNDIHKQGIIIDEWE